MNYRVLSFIKSAASAINASGWSADFEIRPLNILEIGSRRMPGQGAYSDFRALFSPNDSYVGIDIVAGPGVDKLIKASEPLPFRDDTQDVIICTEVLEHVENPSKLIEEIERVVKASGLVLITVPFAIPIHGSPDDYWRFTPSGLAYLFASFTVTKVGYIGFSCNPSTIALVSSNDTRSLPIASSILDLWVKQNSFYQSSINCFERAMRKLSLLNPFIPGILVQSTRVNSFRALRISPFKSFAPVASLLMPKAMLKKLLQK